MKKRLLSLLLVAAMSVSLFGCGGSGDGENSGGQSNTEEQGDSGSGAGQQSDSGEDTEKKTKEQDSNSDDTAAKNGEIKIGVNYFGSASYALLLLKKNSEVVIEAYGQEAMSLDDEFNVEKIVTDIENMIQSGVDGIIVWSPTETLYPTISQMCQEAEIPFVLNDKVPSDPDIIAELMENPYFAGAVSPDNASYGTATAEYALEQGWKTCLMSMPEIGDPSATPRYEAFKEKFEAEGGTIVAEVHGADIATAQQKLEDALVANPNPDFIYGTGSDFGIAAVGALEKFDYETKVITADFDETVLGYLKDSTLPILMGDSLIAGTFSAILLENRILGEPILDEEGKVPFITNISAFFLTPDQVDLYNRFWIEEHCYSPEEMKNMCTINNPEFGYQEFVDAISNYSFEERLKAKLDEGKVTQEELEAAGVMVQ